ISNTPEHYLAIGCGEKWGMPSVRSRVVGGAVGWLDTTSSLVQGRENVFHLDRAGHRRQGDRGPRLLPVRAHRLLAELPRLAAVPARRRPARELPVDPGRAGLAPADLRVALHHPPQRRDLGGV